MISSGIVVKVKHHETYVHAWVQGAGCESRCYRWFDMFGENAEQVRPGDALWYQDRYVYWTPQNGECKDVKIRAMASCVELVVTGEVEK